MVRWLEQGMESQRNRNGNTRVYLDEDETNARVVRCGAVPNRTGQKRWTRREALVR